MPQRGFGSGAGPAVLIGRPERFDAVELCAVDEIGVPTLLESLGLCAALDEWTKVETI